MATRTEVLALGTEELCEFLSSELEHLAPDTVESFRSARIRGSVFLDLSEEDLRELVRPLGDRKEIVKLINGYKRSQVSGSVC